MLQQKISSSRIRMLLLLIICISATLALFSVFGKIIKNNFIFTVNRTEQKPIIVTNKIEYFPGEEVKFLLFNNLSKGIWYVSGELNCSEDSYKVYKLSNNVWQEILIHPPVCFGDENDRELVHTVLLSKNFIDIEWNQNYWDIALENYNIQAGTYVISMRYREQNGVNIYDNTVYSNAFIIKEKTVETSKDFYSCDQDSDCVSVKADCCGCTAGGKAIALNKAHQNGWLENLGCKDTMCPAVMSNDSSCINKEPKCENNKCKLK